MGLNYLLHRHQVSLVRADAASGVEARRSHRLLAEGYARQIDALVGPLRDTDVPLVPLPRAAARPDQAETGAAGRR